MASHPLSPPHASYLPHLDGLRFLALFGVLLFHFEVPHFAGGFIGVDIFLVLSGFLISRNILHCIQCTTFSLRNFYIRRFWRLYPSSLATAAVALLLAFLSFPADLSLSTIRTAVASLLLGSNIRFWRESGYFDDDAVLKPLLHTWSLSLEEQFYFFWPLLFSTASAVVYKWRPVLTAFVAIVSLLSFAFATILHPNYPSFVFFMLPCRVYEFGIGAICALSEHIWSPTEEPSVMRKAVDNLISTWSLGVICTSYIIMPQNNFPLYALMVVFATVAIIATPGSLCCKWVLANSVARFLGNLTYAAYLMHWIVFVFARYFSSGLRVTMPSQAVLTLLTFVSAWVLRNAVEIPLRKSKAKYILPLGIGISATAAFCALGIYSNGWGFRFRAEDTMDVRRSVALTFRKMCVDPDYVKRNDFLNNYSDGCRVGDLTKPASNIFVMGDSYARHLIPAFNKIGKEKGMSFMFNFKTNCPLMGKGDTEIRTKDDFCNQFQKRRWKLLEGEPVKDAEPLPRNSTIVVASFGVYKSMETRRNRLTMLNADIAAAGHQLMAAGEPPGMLQEEKWRFACIDIERSPLVQIAKLAFGEKNASSCVSPWMKPRGRAQEDWEAYQRLFSEDLPDSPFLDLYGPLCKKNEEGEPICRLLRNFNKSSKGVPNLGYGRDGHHLTIQGSEFLSAFIENSLPLPDAIKGQ